MVFGVFSSLFMLFKAVSYSSQITFAQAENDAVGQELQKQLEAAGNCPIDEGVRAFVLFTYVCQFLVESDIFYDFWHWQRRN